MVSLNSHAKDLSCFWPGKIIWQSPMSKYSSLRVGGPAEAVIPVHNLAELKRLLSWLRTNDIDWWIIGKGSNILVSDKGLAGVIIILDGDFRAIDLLSSTRESVENRVFVRAGAGCPLPRLVTFCSTRGLTGFEFAVAIPGSVGGAIVMNAGAWGLEIGTLVDSVNLIDATGRIRSLQGPELGFAYRKSSLPQNSILLDAIFALTPGSPEAIRTKCRKYQELRLQKQPHGELSAGSFFKNPPNDSAGRLIDQAGFKGFSIGGAKVSEKHANFIVNTGNATAADIIKLMQVIQQKVQKEFGIILEPEVHILGENVCS